MSDQHLFRFILWNWKFTAESFAWNYDRAHIDNQ